MKYPLLIKKDCIKWMSSQKDKSIDCVITSPPYNLNIKYSKYKDNLSRKEYLGWLSKVSKEIKRVLKDEGHFFLINSDPYIAIDVCMVFREDFELQNNFTWVKHIAVHDKGYGQYKPITSKRYASNTTESIFHFTKDGDVEVNRLAIGQRNKTHEKYPELYSEGRHRAVARRKVSKKLGYKTQLISHITGNLDQVTQMIASKAITSKNNCIIFGGEPTVNVIGNGKGGRNQELVLRLYEKLKHKKPDFTFASIGTDGIDGNTKFAGSIFSTKHNYDGRLYLNNNDSSSFFKKFGGLIKTGITQNNVNDIGVIIRHTP